MCRHLGRCHPLGARRSPQYLKTTKPMEARPMTLDELRTELATVTQGKYARVPYEIYAEVFPPGEPDQNARTAAYGRSPSLSGFKNSRTSLTTNRYGSSKRHNLSIPAVRNRGPFPPCYRAARRAELAQSVEQKHWTCPALRCFALGLAGTNAPPQTDTVPGVSSSRVSTARAIAQDLPAPRAACLRGPVLTLERRVTDDAMAIVDGAPCRVPLFRSISRAVLGLPGPLANYAA